MTQLTTIQKISNQIRNQEALAKIIRPTGVGQEYTPVINFTELGSDLLSSPKVLLTSKQMGYQLVSGEDQTKMVYSEMGCVDSYNKDCFTDLHDKILNDYKSIMNNVVEQAVEDGLVEEVDGNILKSEIANVQKPVTRKETDKVRVKAKMR